MMLYYLLWFVIVFVAVHVLKCVPVVCRLFLFPEQKRPQLKGKAAAIR